ncbi:MAG: UDP-N-acetylmuramate--L-alanine ligase [Chloroflexota bacterium]|nr:UDP-N-acetylmuramate--L-alanine ligase [Chloroflexota bacterium]
MRYHVIGIGGTGMSAVARLLAARGVVTGSDDGRWPLAEALRPLGVTVHESFDPRNVIGADVVIRSSAYGDEHPEVVAARSAGITVWRRHDAWRHLAKDVDVVAVAGTHGKTTTTAMCWAALRGARHDPSLVCGAEVREAGANAYVGSGHELVIEADEYDRTFLALSPAVAVVTNVEHDHVDHFPTREEYADAFLAFAARVVPGGTLVACADDPGARELARRAGERLRGRADVVTYGTAPGSDVLIADAETDGRGARAEIRLDEGRVPLALAVPGVHNLRNATAAVLAARALGVRPGEAAAALASVTLPGRRLEVLGRANGITVVDDYAHHPTEIRAAIDALRPAAAGRLVVLFQPHTPSRLRAFFDEFAAALAAADVAIVAETFASARERRDVEGLARRLADAARATYAPDVASAGRMLAEGAREGDVLLVLGAGDIRAAGAAALELIAAREGSPA